MLAAAPPLPAPPLVMPLGGANQAIAQARGDFLLVLRGRLLKLFRYLDPLIIWAQQNKGHFEEAWKKVNFASNQRMLRRYVVWRLIYSTRNLFCHFAYGGVVLNPALVADLEQTIVGLYHLWGIDLRVTTAFGGVILDGATRLYFTFGQVDFDNASFPNAMDMQPFLAPGALNPLVNFNMIAPPIVPQRKRWHWPEALHRHACQNAPLGLGMFYITYQDYAGLMSALVPAAGAPGAHTQSTAIPWRNEDVCDAALGMRKYRAAVVLGVGHFPAAETAAVNPVAVAAARGVLGSFNEHATACYALLPPGPPFGGFVLNDPELDFQHAMLDFGSLVYRFVFMRFRNGSQQNFFSRPGHRRRTLLALVESHNLCCLNFHPPGGIAPPVRHHGYAAVPHVGQVVVHVW